jgi:hypothetical protein
MIGVTEPPATGTPATGTPATDQTIKRTVFYLTPVNNMGKSKRKKPNHGTLDPFIIRIE